VAVPYPESVAAISWPHGQPSRVPLTIELPEGKVTAEIAAKSLRRAQQTIQAEGPDNVAVMVQCRLDGTKLVGARLIAQAKAEKAAPSDDAVF